MPSTSSSARHNSRSIQNRVLHATRYISRSPQFGILDHATCGAPASAKRDTVRVPLQFQLILMMLAHQLTIRVSLQFEFFMLTYQFNPTIRNSYSTGSRRRTNSSTCTIRVSLQFAFAPILVLILGNSCWRTSTCARYSSHFPHFQFEFFMPAHPRYNSRSPPIRLSSNS